MADGAYLFVTLIYAENEPSQNWLINTNFSVSIVKDTHQRVPTVVRLDIFRIFGRH